MSQFIIDIYSKGDYPANVLSNFYPNKFNMPTKGGFVQIKSMEGFLQAIKCREEYTQRAILGLSGLEAKNAGAQHTQWKQDGLLFWDGVYYNRYSCEYWALLKRAYSALAENETFSRGLLATRGMIISHRIGKWRRCNSVLTWWEFCFLLSWQRRIIFQQRTKIKG